MARTTEFGRHIISAGEIGAYTVCPEAWKLKAIAHQKPTKAHSVKTGVELHETWAKDVDELAYLNKTGKIVAFLIVLAAAAAVILNR